MADIRRITSLDAATLQRLIVGYTTAELYTVSRSDDGVNVSIELRLVSLDLPLVKRYEPLDEAMLQDYLAMPAMGHSFAAFDNEDCAGIALCEPVAWNASLWVREFHVAEAARGRGIGRQLMEAIVADARAAGLRCVICETQSTNVPAIRFYRAVGFTLEGIDVSYYSNRDLERGEVAVFMKRLIGSES